MKIYYFIEKLQIHNITLSNKHYVLLWNITPRSFKIKPGFYLISLFIKMYLIQRLLNRTPKDFGCFPVSSSHS